MDYLTITDAAEFFRLADPQRTGRTAVRKHYHTATDANDPKPHCYATTRTANLDPDIRLGRGEVFRCMDAHCPLYQA